MGKNKKVSKMKIGTVVDVVVDRPKGSKHPKYPETIYPINYGFIPNTISGDGMEIDAYIIGEEKSLKTFHGQVIAIIHRNDDVEIKLVVAKEGSIYTRDEIESAVSFIEHYYDHEIILN
jgi:inorganic pyrophosphatase